MNEWFVQIYLNVNYMAQRYYNNLEDQGWGVGQVAS